MKDYIIQVRFSHDGRLLTLGVYTARSSTGAIAQACRDLKYNGDDVVEITATEDK